MKLKHKFTSIALGILVLASPVIGTIAPVLGSGTASAASLGTFQYAPSLSGVPALPDGSIEITCSGASCPGGDGITYKYVAGSKYRFDNNNGDGTVSASSGSGGLGGLLNPGGSCGLVTITISDPKHPENGSLTDECGHKNISITIGNTDQFNTFVRAGGAGSVGGKVIAKLSVDFGETDDTLNVGAVDLTIKCDSANKSDPVCLSLAGLSVSGADGVNTTLATNPVLYSTPLSGFVAGHKYMLCWSADFLKGSDGKVGDPLCTNNFTAKTTAQTVSLSGTGDNTKLTGANGASNGSGSDPSNACESNAGGFGWIICKLIDGLQTAIGGIYDHIINPLLTIEPISTSNTTGNKIYGAWSNFRIYGDIFLFIALLVIVFGESLGGGIIDAYSAKKILPRLLIAALLINISFYLVAILVDIANIVGNGLSDLIIAPFKLSGNFNLQVNTTGTVGMYSLLAGAITWAAISLSGQFMAWLWFSILLPLLLVFLSILVVVMLRQALIVFLVIISPIAFALYCLPNTEKYFRKWWDILFETLLVFPIVTALFAMGKVSAYILSNSSNGALLNGLTQIMGVVALVVPLLLVPFSFKLAGGLIGRAHDLVSGGRQKLGLGQASRDRIKAQGARNRLQARGSAYAALQKQGSKGGVIRRNTVGRLAKGTSGLLGYNVEAEMSAARAEVGKTVNDQIATGKDDEIRGLTVNKNTSRSRMNNGVKEYETLGGAWVKEADVDRGHARWGNDTFAQQAALSYEMRKAQSEGQLQTLAKNYRSVAQGIDASGRKVGGGWGMTKEEAGGAWIGAAFERQNEHLEYKDTDWQTGELKLDKSTVVKDAQGNDIEGTGLRGVGLVDEMYEKKGSYGIAQMGSNTIEQLKQAHASAQTIIDSSTATADQKAKAMDQQQKVAAIAETFMHQTTAGGGIPEDQVAQATATASGSDRRQANTPGAAHVAERVRELAVQTGVYTQAPGTQPLGPNLPGTPTNSNNPQA